MRRRLRSVLPILLFLVPTWAQAQTPLERLEAPTGLALSHHVFHVTAASELPDAINRAAGGDTILVDPSVVYEGQIALPPVPGKGWVTLRTSAGLPEARILRTDVGKLFTIVSRRASEPALVTLPGAHHWRIVGAHLTQTGGNTYGIFRCGEAEGWTSIVRIPHHIELDRSLVDIDPDKVEERRGIQPHCDDLTIRRSIVDGIHETGNDSQAIGGWEGTSRIAIIDNELTAASEVILFGGAASSAITPVPQDIEIRGNWIHLHRSWLRKGSWNFKNLLELKSARRVHITDNLFETAWPQAQTGWSILFTARGDRPWMVLEDVLFARNVVRDVASGINILGFDNDGGAGTLGRRITITHNLIVTKKDMDPEFHGDGRCLMLLGGPVDVVYRHNTCINDGAAAVTVDTFPGGILGFEYADNLQLHGAYGVVGTARAPGTDSLGLFVNPVFERNAFADCQGTPYPAGTLCVTLDEFKRQFVDYAGGDYTLTASSPWRRAGTDGGDLGR